MQKFFILSYALLVLYWVGNFFMMFPDWTNSLVLCINMFLVIGTLYYWNGDHSGKAKSAN